MAQDQDGAEAGFENEKCSGPEDCCAGGGGGRGGDGKSSR